MKNPDVPRLLDPSSTRSAITHELKQSAEIAVAESEVPGRRPHATFVAGTGYDFDEFGAIIAAEPRIGPEGVACFWTEKCSLPFNEDVYAIQQQYVEPTRGKKDRLLLVAQSVIADKMEVLTILSRIMPIIKPRYLTIASALIDVTVKAELADFLQDYFADGDLRFIGSELNVGLRDTRAGIAQRLDDRPNKLVPIMSKWLFTRRFGPRPDFDIAVVAGLGPGG